MNACKAFMISVVHQIFHQPGAVFGRIGFGVGVNEINLIDRMTVGQAEPSVARAELFISVVAIGILKGRVVQGAPCLLRQAAVGIAEQFSVDRVRDFMEKILFDGVGIVNIEGEKLLSAVGAGDGSGVVQTVVVFSFQRTDKIERNLPDPIVFQLTEKSLRVAGERLFQRIERRYDQRTVGDDFRAIIRQRAIGFFSEVDANVVGFAKGISAGANRSGDGFIYGRVAPNFRRGTPGWCILRLLPRRSDPR